MNNVKKVFIGIVLVSVCTLVGCATLSGLVGHQNAAKASEVCANALVDLETVYALAQTQIKDPDELAKIANAHMIAQTALTDCVAKGQQ